MNSASDGGGWQSNKQPDRSECDLTSPHTKISLIKKLYEVKEMNQMYEDDAREDYPQEWYDFQDLMTLEREL